MSRTSAPILLQRMRPEDLGVSPDDPCVLAVGITQAGVFEGAILDAVIARVGGRSDQDVTVTYTWSGVSVASDLTAPLTVTVTLPANVMVLAIPKQTTVRVGAQGDRDVAVTLSAPVNCTLSPSNYFADCQISDAAVAQAVIGAFTISNVTATEGETITAQIRRVSGDAAASVVVGWQWASTGGDADFAAGAVLSGTTTIDAAVSQVNLSVVSAALIGLQGNRAINLTLTSITNGAISTANPAAAFTLKDFSEPPPVTVGVFASSTEEMPDDGSVDCIMNIKRLSGTATVSVNWQFTSSLHGFDFDPSGGPTGGPSGTATLPVGTNQVDVSANLRDRSGDTVGNRTITCTISNAVGGNITTAFASQILTDNVTGPPPGGLPRFQPVVPLNKQHWVGFTITGQTPKKSYQAGRAGLAEAMSDPLYVAGDVIVLADGTYSGNLITFTKNGTKTADGSSHFMIQARNHGAATINLQIVLTGSYLWITGCRLRFYQNDPTPADQPYKSSASPQFWVKGNGFWLTNCEYKNKSVALIDGPNPPLENIRICFNDLLCDDCPGSWGTMSMIVIFAVGTNDYMTRDTDIAYNKMTYGPAADAISGGGEQNSRIFGYSQDGVATAGATPPRGADQTFRWHHNHMVGNMLEMVYFKRGVTVEYNYMEWLTAPGNNNVTARHGIIETTTAYGTGPVYRGNLLKSAGSVGFEMGGAGAVVSGNRMTGGGAAFVRLFAGCTATPLRDSCEKAQVVENFGFDTVYVGYVSDNRTVGADSVAGRGGWPDGIRIYQGSSTSPWNPSVIRGKDQLGAQMPTANYNVLAGYGTGLAAKITTVTEAELIAQCGWKAPGSDPGGTGPVKTTDPSITGPTTVGSTLTCNHGTWSGTAPIDYNYIWKQTNGTTTTDIGVNASTFTLTAAQLGLNIFCRVTAINTAGNASANTAQTVAVTNPVPGTFVPVVQLMAVEDELRAGDITDMSPTFKEQINGYYIRRSPPLANGGYDPAGTPDPDTGGSDTGGVRPPPIFIYGLCANPVHMTNNRIYDFRGCVGYQHDLRPPSGFPAPYTDHGYQYTLVESGGDGVNAVICGLKTYTRNASWIAKSWADIHGEDDLGFNAPAIWISVAGGGSTPNKWQGLYLKDCMDAIQPRADDWLVENIRASCRDDVIENDDQYSGTIRNGYLQGHTLMSVRPGGGSRSTANLHSLVKFEDCIIHMKRQPYDGDEGGDRENPLSWFKAPYTNPDDANRNARYTTADIAGKKWYNSKSCFKSQPENVYPLAKVRVHMVNCLICMDSNAVEGEDATFFPGAGDGSVIPGGTRTGSKYENVTLCVRAPGGWDALSSVQTSAQLELLGIKVINKTGTIAEERAADAAFIAAETAWNLANGYDADTTSLTYDTYSWNRKAGGGGGGGGGGPPVISTLPTIVGTPEVGNTLAADQGTWTNNPTTFLYVWKADDVVITGAPSASFKLTTAQLGKVITIQVTASNIEGPGVATSLPTAKVKAASVSTIVKVHDVIHGTTGRNYIRPTAAMLRNNQPGNANADGAWGMGDTIPNLNNNTNTDLDLRGYKFYHHSQTSWPSNRVGTMVKAGHEAHLSCMRPNGLKDGACIFGAEFIGEQPDNTEWDNMKTDNNDDMDDQGIQYQQDTKGNTYYIEHCIFRNQFDGISPNPSGNNIYIIRGCYARGQRDEWIESDNGDDVIKVYDSLCDGAHNIISSRPGGQSAGNNYKGLPTSRWFNIENCIVWCRGQYYKESLGTQAGDRLNYGNKRKRQWRVGDGDEQYYTDAEMNDPPPDGPAGWVGREPIKGTALERDSTPGTGNACSPWLDCKHTIFAFEGLPTSGKVVFPPGTYDDVYLCFLPGFTTKNPKSFYINSTYVDNRGITVLDGDNAQNKFFTARTQWINAHGGSEDSNGFVTLPFVNYVP